MLPLASTTAPGAIVLAPTGVPLHMRALAIYPHSGIRERLKRLRYWLRFAVYLPASVKFDKLMELAELAEAIRSNPRIYEKLHRPYAVNFWRTAQKLKALREHYELIVRKLTPSRFRQVYVSRDLNIAHLDGREFGSLKLCMRYEDQFEKEGELTLSLQAANGSRLVSATFLLHRGARGEPQILITTLQGASDALAKDLTRDLTKAMHGLRPKALMVFVLQELARHWGIKRLVGLDDAAHVYRHRRYLRRAPRLKGSLDEFWLECGGRPQKSGFDLPLQTTRRVHTEIPSNKRAMYTRRYALMSALSEEIQKL